MRILHLIDSAGLYGAEKMLVGLCVEQRRLGHDAWVLSARLPAEATKALDVELQKSDVPVLSWPMHAGLNFRAMQEIYTWATQQQVDVFHSHGYKFNVLLAATAHQTDINKITTVHGYTSARLFDRMTIYKTLDRLSHLAFNRVVYVSAALQRRSLVKASKRATIPNGIDTNSLAMIEARVQQAAADARIRLVAVGRLAAEKDYELLLHTVGLLRKRGVQLSLDIFGEGPEETKLRRIIASEELHDVELRGYSSNVSTELSRRDMLVVSSRAEGMPIAIIEAMCLGIKIAATGVGGIPALLASYPLATLAERRRPAELADAIQAQIQNPRSLYPAEVARFRRQFSSSTMALNYVQLYENTLRSSSCRLPSDE